VLHQVLNGRSQKQAALVLGISVRTVQWHVANIHGKLNTHSPAQLILACGDHRYCCRTSLHTLDC